MRSWFGKRAFRVPVETLVPGRDPITLHAYYPSFAEYYRHCELQTKRWFLENIEQDWICLDIGSNIGYHTILMAECAQRGFVYSFEPTSTSKMLEKNALAAGVTNFELVEKAVGERSGLFKEQIYRIWGQRSEPSRKPFISIDDFVEQRNLNRIDLIKIDIDGFDYEALLGAKKTLECLSPIVIVELNHALATRGHSVGDALAFMLDRKYSDVLILDNDNYLFTRRWSLGEPYPQALRVVQDRRNPLENSVASEIPFADITAKGKLQNRARGDVFEQVVISGPAWDYAVAFSLPGSKGKDLGVVIELELDKGELGVFLTDSGGSVVLGQERIARSRAGVQKLIIPIDDAVASTLVVRKTSGDEAVFRILSCTIHPIVREELANHLSLQKLTSAELGLIISLPPGVSWSSNPLREVVTCSPEDLAKSSGFDGNFPRIEEVWPYNERLMEREDASLLAYLYGQIKPERHFEFGTWEGFGATLCMRYSDATVWTVNLPGGEDLSGNSVYTQSREPYDPGNPGQRNRSARTDSGSWIGWMYRKSGFEHRVHQILADSKDLDITGLRGSFDSVLIDGSHQREFVSRDIENALALIKPSGWIFLHDFSLDARVVRTNSATHGVLAAVADHMEVIVRDYDALWVTGTLLLLLRPKRNSAGGRGGSAA